MKTISLVLGLAILTIGLMSFETHFKQSDTKTSIVNTEAERFVVPENVKSILDKSCLPCHGTNGSGKARMKWNYDKMNSMKTSKMISKLSKIETKVESGKMPTKKFNKKYPDRRLSEIDKKVLTDWASELAENLLIK